MALMKPIHVLSVLIVAVLLCLPSLPLSGATTSQEHQTIYKNIAVYPSIVPAIKVLQYALQYGWTIDGVTYRFNVTEIGRREALGRGPEPLTPDNYDVLVIGASARQYFHDFDFRWRNNVRSFVAEGGGYVGICGGANEASLGMQQPSSLPDRIITSGALGIANVYVNDDQQQEWQYLYKSSGLGGGIPVACELSDHPIMAASPSNPRVIRYEGGPGLYQGDGSDPLLGDIVPLAIYAEEVSERAPIHFWEKRRGEWQQTGPVETDVEGQYAAIATTYGDGRVALFGPHPEERTTVGGHVEEFPGRSKYTLYRESYLYEWVGGDETNWTYNWWMLHRAAAWAAGVPDEHLPPVSHAEIYWEEPNIWHPGLYLNGRRIGPAPWGNTIIGDMTLSVYVEGTATIDFYLDGRRVHSDSMEPYTWRLDDVSPGWHQVRAEYATPDGTTAYAQADIFVLTL